MAVLLALLSAVCFGVSDYIGGRASRRTSPLTVACSAEAVVFPALLVAIPVIESSPLTASAFGWGLLGGAAGSAGVLALYAALARGNMTVVAPVTGVVAAVLPVVVGIAQGERPAPLVTLGIVGAIVSVALIGGLVGALHHPVEASTIALSVLAGALFGVLFVAFAQPGDEAGLWPLFAARFGGLPLLAGAYAVARRRRIVDPVTRPTLVIGLWIGLVITTANALYLLAAARGLLAVVAVVVSLYPASTVALAAALDGERSTRPQQVGMAIAATAVTLISLG